MTDCFDFVLVDGLGRWDDVRKEFGSCGWKLIVCVVCCCDGDDDDDDERVRRK